MVLGPRTKPRKNPSVHLDYIIHIQEIKPWPPSQSLRTLRSVLIRWDHGDRASGSTNQVVPSLGTTGSGVGDGRIEFNESIRLLVTLKRELSVKSGNGDTFQKNCIEFNLYEPRRGKAVKGQLLGSAVLDLADHGIVKEKLSVSVPVNCQRSYRNTVQPLLFLNIEPVDKRRLGSSSKDSLVREPSMDRSRTESVSTMMSEEYAVEEAEEEAEIASSFLTDDDISSHSSVAVPSLAAESSGSLSPPQTIKENGIVIVNGSAREGIEDHAFVQFFAKSSAEQADESRLNSAKDSSSSSMDLSSDLAWISRKIGSRGKQSSAIEMKEEVDFSNTSIKPDKESVTVKEDSLNSNKDMKVQINLSVDGSSISSAEIKPAESNGHENAKLDFEDASPPDSDSLLVSERDSHTQLDFSDDECRAEHETHSREIAIVYSKEQEIVYGLKSISSQSEIQQLIISGDDTVCSSREDRAISSIPAVDRSKQGKSVRSLTDSIKSDVSIRSNQFIISDAQIKSQDYVSSGHKDSKVFIKETRNQLLESKIQQLEHKVQVLEGELIEAASIEISLYSVITEHVSSATKVHAPARRLSRLYFHASKHNSKSRRATAADSIMSGLVLVAKACGNDVPRLSFWLSNVIVLRAIMIKSFGDKLPGSSHFLTGGLTGDKKSSKKTLPLKWEPSPANTGLRNSTEDDFYEWANPQSFVHALEKVEKWIFSRIIESLWWQTFTPHMQSGVAKSIAKITNAESTKSSKDNSIAQQPNYSVELWERAFWDASERICPLRAEGHQCGCMPVLYRLIMEQLIARLDVAMFNAILRESADEIPTDPVADPISDPNVLPIPPGKSSFGAGAQLKNAIGNWCRWLTDLFGTDDDCFPEDGDCMEHDDHDGEDDDDDDRRSHDPSSKCFRLLNALSDLMMLPKDMLLSRTVRKEVCPTFGSPLIRRVLNSFVPDEFCPDPIPRVVLEALNLEDPHGEDDGGVVNTTTNFPCAAPPITYLAPSASSVAIGEIDSSVWSSSCVVKKSQTSDDELDELDSPLNSIVVDGFLQQSFFRSSRRVSSSAAATRYQLLREAWNRIG